MPLGLRQSVAMLKQVLSLRGRFHRKILVLLVTVMTVLLLRQGWDDDNDDRHYPPGTNTQYEEVDVDPASLRQMGLGDRGRDSNRELQRYQDELLRADARMNAFESLDSDADADSDELDPDYPIGDPNQQDSWIEVEKAHLPAPPESKMVDSETFERPLAVTLDTHVMTDAGVAFVQRLQSGKPRPKSYNLTIMTINHQMGSVFDARFVLEPMGVEFLEYSFSEHCAGLGTCFKDLDVINADNTMSLTTDTRAKFYERYREDELFQRVDAFLCVYPASLCELFIPFNKSLIVLVESRHDIGRLEDKDWEAWNDNLRTLNQFKGKHFLRASNAYDSEYVRYYTNFAPRVLAPMCSYVKHSYSSRPSRAQYLLMPIRQLGFQEQFLKEFRQEVRDTAGANATLTPATQLYPKLRPSDLVQHPALVLVPHQVSYVALAEYHRMGIPMFVPSMELLARWHLRSNVVFDKMWNERRKWQKRHGLFKGVQPLPNANDESSSDAIGFWLMFSDFYYQPYFTYYTSVADLVRKLNAANRGELNLQEISTNTKKYAELVYNKSGREWRRIVDALVVQKSDRAKHESRVL